MESEQQEHGILMNEIRYAQRITQRTARLYRRVGTFFTFSAILGGSGLASALAQNTPSWLILAGAIVLAATGAAALAIRPLEKAITNEQDLKRYTALESKALSMDANTLREELAKTREGDAAEIELLRDVAYNDVVIESGRADLKVSLSLPQKFISALA